MLGTFCNMLASVYLQCHLLAIATHNIEKTVRADDEYLQLQPANDWTRAVVWQGEVKEETTELSSANYDKTSNLISVIQKMADQIERLQNLPVALQRPKSGESNDRINHSWGYDKTGHICRDCPKPSGTWTNTRMNYLSGYKGGPEKWYHPVTAEFQFERRRQLLLEAT